MASMETKWKGTKCKLKPKARTVFRMVVDVVEVVEVEKSLKAKARR